MHYREFEPNTLIPVNQEMIKSIREKMGESSYRAFSERLDLDCNLMNIVLGRKKYILLQDFKRIFNGDVHHPEPEKVNSRHFTGFSDLYIFLKNSSERKLHKELFPDKTYNARTFSDKIRTIDYRIEKMILKKFLDEGLDTEEVECWLKEFKQLKDDQVPYGELKPILEYLNKNLGMGFSAILKRPPTLYENGELKHVSKKVYDSALELKTKAERALSSGSRLEVEKLKLEIYRRSDKDVIFAEIEPYLLFLKKCGKSSKEYLGKPITSYKTKYERMALWRANKIKEDFKVAVIERSDLVDESIKEMYLKLQLKEKTNTLKLHFRNRLINDKTNELENIVLISTNGNGAKTDNKESLRVDLGAYYLGLSRKAFDLLIGRNMEILRKVIDNSNGSYKISIQYLDNLKNHQHFQLLKERYELLASKSFKKDNQTCNKARKPHSTAPLPYSDLDFKQKVLENKDKDKSIENRLLLSLGDAWLQNNEIRKNRYPEMVYASDALGMSEIAAGLFIKKNAGFFRHFGVDYNDGWVISRFIAEKILEKKEFGPLKEKYESLAHEYSLIL